MASKKSNLARGDKRTNGVRIIRSMKLTPKSSPEKKTQAVLEIAKVNKFTPAAARSMVNWCFRNPDVVRTIKTSKAA